MLQTILEVLWFFLPALVANMAPVFVTHLSLFNVPLDGGLRLRGRRVLGDNKTVRGLVFGVILGSITSLFQYTFQTLPAVDAISIVSHRGVGQALAWGALLGFGALFGDALKSFVKRQLDIAPGRPWQPFDQIDIVVGVLLFTQWWWPLSLAQIIVAFTLVGLLSYTTSFVGVQLKIKKSV